MVPQRLPAAADAGAVGAVDVGTDADAGAVAGAEVVEVPICGGLAGVLWIELSRDIWPLSSIFSKGKTSLLKLSCTSPIIEPLAVRLASVLL